MSECCNAVTAYKDNKGGLHLSQRACELANAQYEEQAKRVRIDQKIGEVYIMMLKTIPGDGPNYYHRDRYGYSSGEVRYMIEQRWREIRNVLNTICD